MSISASMAGESRPVVPSMVGGWGDMSSSDIHGWGLGSHVQ